MIKCQPGRGVAARPAPPPLLSCQSRGLKCHSAGFYVDIYDTNWVLAIVMDKYCEQAYHEPGPLPIPPLQAG